MKATEVAELIIYKLKNSKTDFLTHSKLQKLLYYAQGFHLAYYNKQLFEDDIIAAPTGAFIQEIDDIYRKYHYSKIPCKKQFERDFEWNLNNPAHRVIHDVCLVFEEATSSQLECLIKTESPWLNVRVGRGTYDSGVKMDIQDIHSYFLKEYLE